MRRSALVLLTVLACGCGMLSRMVGRDDEELDDLPAPALEAAAPAADAAVAPAAPDGAKPGTGLDTRAIEEAVGLTGATMPDGVFRITRPRGDLKVSLDGFAITPRMGLAGWIAFRAHPSGAMLLGVMPVAADELQPVVSALVNAGLDPSALHPHFVGEEPRVAFVHFGGLGNAVALARGVRDVLEAIVRVRTAHPVKPRTSESRSELDVVQLDAHLRLRGEHDGQVYRVTASRPDVRLTEMGAELGATMSPASWAAFQGTAERTAVAGEIMVSPSEVQPVIHALRGARIGIVGIHDNAIHGESQMGFVAFWGVGRADALATGVRKALDQLAGTSGPAG